MYIASRAFMTKRKRPESIRCLVRLSRAQSERLTACALPLHASLLDLTAP
jgi:hypothetical protein